MQEPDGAAFTWHGDTVRWWRDGSGPPAVLCHGTPWSSRLWDQAAAALAETHTVYRWDLLGFGRSTQRDGQDVSLRAQSALLAALVDAWGLDRPAVVAHDIGGAIALGAVLLHDVGVRSLTLIDVVALAPWGSPFFRLVRDHAPVFEALPAPLHRALVDAYIRTASPHPVADDLVAQLAAPWHGPVGQAAFYRQIAQADQADTDVLEPRYGEVDVPVHIVWGRDDPWIPVDRARRLQAAFPDANLELVEGAGHLIQHDAPEALLAAIRRGLARA